MKMNNYFETASTFSAKAVRLTSWPGLVARTSIGATLAGKWGKQARCLLHIVLGVLLTSSTPGAPAIEAPAAQCEVVRDVQFGTGGGQALRLDLVRPKPLPAQPMPVVVFIYGGAWRTGSRANGIPLLTRFAKRGYLGVSIEYRFSQDALFPAQIEDCKCAIRFLRAKAKTYNLDPDRIGVWGQSAGGHLAALLGTTGDVKNLEGSGGWAEYSSRVNAVVDCFGPTDFLQMDSVAGLVIKHNAPESPESRLIGGPIQENPDKAARANPITYVTSNAPPFLILHGSSDPLVPVQQSQLLEQALKRTGVKVTLEVIPGAGHGFVYGQGDAQIDAFFDNHLKRDKSKKSASTDPVSLPMAGGWRTDGQGPARRILFFTKSAGFEHSVIRRTNNILAHAEKVLTDLGKQYGFEVFCTKDGGVFTPANLRAYDAFCFYTTGDLTQLGLDKNPPMSQAAKEALLEAVRNGKGFVGVHSANDSFLYQPLEPYVAHGSKVDPFIAMLGGEFIHHGAQQKATQHVVDAKFPGLENQTDFVLHEEWYTFKDFARDMHVILVQETKGMVGPDYARSPYPSTWARRQGQGRVFYTSLGHREDVWTNPLFQHILLGGLGWAVGNVEADLTPNLLAAAPGYAEIGAPAKPQAANRTAK